MGDELLFKLIVFFFDWLHFFIEGDSDDLSVVQKEQVQLLVPHVVLSEIEAQELVQVLGD